MLFGEQFTQWWQWIAIALLVSSTVVFLAGLVHWASDAKFKKEDETGQTNDGLADDNLINRGNNSSDCKSNRNSSINNSNNNKNNKISDENGVPCDEKKGETFAVGGNECKPCSISSFFAFSPATNKRKLAYECAIVSFVNVFILTLIHLCGFEHKLHLQSLGSCYLVISSVAYVFLTDVLLYAMHVTFHRVRWLSHNVHAYHHRFREPSAFAFAAVHPVELLTSFTILHVVPCFLPIWYIVFYAYMFLAALMPILEHGRGLMLLPWLPLDADFHNRHHVCYGCNYGIGITLAFWDKFFGTYVGEDSNQQH